MESSIHELRRQAESDIASAGTESQIEEFRIKFLARKGLIGSLFEQLGALPAAERPAAGKLLNELRAFVQGLHDARRAALGSGVEVGPRVDLTLSGIRHHRGSKHILTQTLEEITAIFVSMGFGIADGPEIEDDYHNFGALNFPDDHPARDMQDTFFLDDGEGKALLRTHTSPVQIRVMENHQPPVRVICPGKVYRNEAVSSRSLCLFHQVEGLYVDRGVTFSELKGTLVSFIRQFYGSDLKYRFRPTFFPFTEPSADIYIT